MNDVIYKSPNNVNSILQNHGLEIANLRCYFESKLVISWNTTHRICIKYTMIGLINWLSSVRARGIEDDFKYFGLSLAGWSSIYWDRLEVGNGGGDCGEVCFLTCEIWDAFYI